MFALCLAEKHRSNSFSNVSMAGIQVPTPKPDPDRSLFFIFWSLAPNSFVARLLWITQASALPSLRQGQEVLPRDPNVDAVGREGGVATVLLRHANLMVTSACSPYSFCSRAFRKDISVCSGASWRGNGGEGRARVSNDPSPASLPCWEVCFPPGSFVVGVGTLALT